MSTAALEARRPGFDGLIDLLFTFQTNERERDRLLYLPDSSPRGRLTRAAWLKEIDRCMRETHQEVSEADLADFMRPEPASHAGYDCPTFIDMVATAAHRLKMILTDGYADSEQFDFEINRLFDIDVAFLRAAVAAEVRFIAATRKPEPQPKIDAVGPYTLRRWAAILDCSESTVKNREKSKEYRRAPNSKKGQIFYLRDGLPPDIDERIKRAKATQ